MDRGFSYTQICAVTGLSCSTISRIHSQYCSELPTHPPGQPSKLSSTSQRYLVRLVTGPQSLKATQAAKEVSRATGQPIHPKTVSRSLRKQGLKAVVKQKKPFISSHHRKERLNFAYQYQHWTLEDWKLVIFSDETKINCLGSDGCSWVWKRPGEPFTSRLAKPTVKYGGGSLMLWGCILWEGIGFSTRIQGTLNAELYTQILEDELMQTLEYYGKEVEDVIFQQDNECKHTSKMAKECLQRLGLRVLAWPAYSPDLKPIENIWLYLKKRLNGYPEAPKGIEEL